MPKKIIYLDNASTTPCYKEVVTEMNKYMLSEYGNPSSMHELGEKARKAVESAKKIISGEIGCKPWEIIFTSGGTESNNLVLQGVAKANPEKRKIITSSIEHSSIHELCNEMKKYDYEIVVIGVDKLGILDITRLEREIDDETLLVSVIHGNNEIGVIQNIKNIGELCRKNNVLFHTDAVQSFCKEKIKVSDMNIDLLSASGHKIGASKGIGFLYVKEKSKIEGIIMGGGQESGIRPGTQNVPAIMGFAKAVEISRKKDGEKIRKLRDYFMSELEKIGGEINGSKKGRLNNNVNVSFLEKDGEDIAIKLSEKGIMCSTKSACMSKQKKENRILKAIELDDKYIEGTLRFSLSEENTKKDVDITIKEIKKIIALS